MLTAKILGEALAWIKKKPPRSTFKRLFLETKTLLIPIMSGSVKSPAKGLKDLECEQGVITTRPPIPNVAAVDPYKKQEKTEIKTRLPDGTNYQMAPFCLGTNEDYINHVIAMIRLVKQKDLENSMEKAFVSVYEIKEKVGPIHKKIKMSKSAQEKEGFKKTLETTKNALKVAEKNTLKEAVKCYKLFCTYFVGKARTQWDKVAQEMHQKDPWVAVNRSLNLGPRKKTQESFVDCIELHKLTIFYCDVAELQRYYMQQQSGSPNALRCEPS